MLSDLKAYFTTDKKHDDIYYLECVHPLVQVLATNLHLTNNDIARVRTIEDIHSNYEELAGIGSMDLDTVLSHYIDYFTSFTATNIVNQMVLDCVFSPHEYELLGDCTVLGELLEISDDKHHFRVRFDTKYRVLENQVNKFINDNSNYDEVEELLANNNESYDAYEMFSTTAVYYEMITFKSKTVARKFRKLYRKSKSFRNLLEVMGFIYARGYFWTGVLYDLESYTPWEMYDTDMLIKSVLALRKELGYTHLHSLKSVTDAFDHMISVNDGESYRMRQFMDSLLNTFESNEEVIL